MVRSKLLLSSIILSSQIALSSPIYETYVEQISMLRSQSKMDIVRSKNRGLRTNAASLSDITRDPLRDMELLVHTGRAKEARKLLRSIKVAELSVDDYMRYLSIRYYIYRELKLKRPLARSLTRVSRERKYMHFLQNGEKFTQIREVLLPSYKKSFEKFALNSLSDLPYTGASREAFAYFQELYAEAKVPYRVMSRLSRVAAFDEKVFDWVYEKLDEDLVDYSRYRGREIELKGTLLYRLKKYEETVDHYEDSYNKVLSSKSKTRMYRNWAKSLSASGLQEEAAKVYEKGLATVGKNRRSLALWQSYADFMLAQGKMAEALEEQNQMVKIAKTRFTMWDSFWLRFRMGEYSSALDMANYRRFKPLDRQYPAMSYYWKARILEKMGRSEESLKLDRRILDRWGEGYYAMLVMKKYFDPNTGEVLAGGRSILPMSLEADKLSFDVRRWYAMQSRLPHKRLKGIADIYKDYQSNNQYWQSKYPRPYWPTVQKVAEFWGFDPLLIYSFMRAESFYSTHAKSPVGARGLMQIMPYTGKNISSELGDSGFSLEDLHNPYISIYYSGFYLSKLLSIFKGNLFYSIAAYNAGPLKVNEWLQTCRLCSEEEFVEAIPFYETRRYVKKVLGNYAQYSRIYKSELVPGLKPLSLEQSPSSHEMY